MLMQSRKPSTNFLDIAIRSVWIEGTDVSLPKMLSYGALVWACYSLANLVLNGIVLDELIFPVQILTKTVQYPNGHSHEIFYSSAYNLFHYLGAILWWLNPDPRFISGIRNFLFLFSSAFLPYALTVLLTRTPMWGHIAAVLTLTEGMIQFHGLYPIQVFPGFYGAGHFGMHAALLTVVFLIGQCWMIGGLFLGLLPSIHPALSLIVWPWAMLFLFSSRRLLRGRHSRRLIAGFVIGAVINGALAIAILIFNKSSIVSPYLSTLNGDTIRQNFINLTDPHRSLFSLWSIGYLLNPILFFGLLAIFRRSPAEENTEIPDARNSVSWIMVIGFLCWGYLYACGLYLRFVGPLPPYIDTSMPFRDNNLTALLILPLIVVLMMKTISLRKEKLPALATIIIYVFATMCCVVISRKFAFRSVPFATMGLLGTLLLFPNRTTRNYFAKMVVALLICGIGIFLFPPGRAVISYYVLSLILAGLLLFIFSRTLTHPFFLLYKNWFPICLTFAVVLLAICLLRGPHIEDSWSNWAKISKNDRLINQWLMQNAKPNELILVPIYPRSEIQIKTSHPVLFESETLWLMVYMPKLAPSIGSLVRDLYGIDYSDAGKLKDVLKDGRLDLISPVWLDGWKRRTQQEWKELADRYAFHLVLAPVSDSLDLPVALSGDEWNLYKIPD